MALRWNRSSPLRLIIPLHQQLIAGVQETAAGNHQDGCHRRSVAVRDDPGIVVLAFALEDDDELLAFTRRGAS
jgi:hypothetical protein